MEGREGGAIDASLLAVPFKMSDGKADVLTMLEIEGYSLLRGHQGPIVPTELFAYAIDDTGAVADFLGQTIELDLEKVQPALDRRGFKFLGHLALDPGSYEIRVLVRNALTGATGMRVGRVDVPAFQQAESALLPPLFIEPDGVWLIGEERRAEGEDLAYPLKFGRQRAVPSARPILRAGVPVPMLLVGHNLDRGALTGAGRLLPADGGDSHELELTVQRRSDTECCRRGAPGGRCSGRAAPRPGSIVWK